MAGKSRSATALSSSALAGVDHDLHLLAGRARSPRTSSGSASRSSATGTIRTRRMRRAHVAQLASVLGEDRSRRPGRRPPLGELRDRACHAEARDDERRAAPSRRRRADLHAHDVGALGPVSRAPPRARPPAEPRERIGVEDARAGAERVRARAARPAAAATSSSLPLADEDERERQPARRVLRRWHGARDDLHDLRERAHALAHRRDVEPCVRPPGDGVKSARVRGDPRRRRCASCSCSVGPSFRAISGSSASRGARPDDVGLGTLERVERAR